MGKITVLYSTSALNIFLAPPSHLLCALHTRDRLDAAGVCESNRSERPIDHPARSICDVQVNVYLHLHPPFHPLYL